VNGDGQPSSRGTNLGRNKIFFYPETSRLGLRRTLRPVQWSPMALPLGVKLSASDN
jgi:hypothetical protein